MTTRPRLLRAAASPIVTARVMRLMTARNVRARSAPGVEGLSPMLRVDGHLELGERVTFRSVQFRSHISVARDAVVSLGSRCYVNQGVSIHAAKRIVIGEDTRIGDLCAIYDTSFHELEEDAGVLVAPVEIGENVWLARTVTVLAGVSIGAHSVIAAGSVVTDDVPPRTLTGGVPARPIRELRASETYRRV